MHNATLSRTTPTDEWLVGDFKADNKGNSADLILSVNTDQIHPFENETEDAFRSKSFMTAAETW